MQNRSLQRNMYRKSPRNRPFFTDRSSTKFAPKNPSIFPRNRAFIDANLTLKKPRNLTFSHDLSKACSPWCFFWGGGGWGSISFFLSFILHNVCKKLALDQLDLHWRTLRNELLNVQTIFMTQSDYWKLVLIVFFCAEIFDPFDCKLDEALLWFHHHRKSRMISR